METYVEFWGYIVLFFSAIGYVAAFIYIIRDAILLLVPAIKCRKVAGCKKDDCPFRAGCRHIAYSDKEKAKILKKMNQLK